MTVASVHRDAGGHFYVCEGFDMPLRFDDKPPYRRALAEALLRPSLVEIEYPSPFLFPDLTGT